MQPQHLSCFCYTEKHSVSRFFTNSVSLSSDTQNPEISDSQLRLRINTKQIQKANKNAAKTI